MHSDTANDILRGTKNLPLDGIQTGLVNSDQFEVL